MSAPTSAASATSRDFALAFTAGAIAAAAGAFGWVKLTAATGKSFGAVAVLIGLLTGLAVRWGLKRGGAAAAGLAGFFTLIALLGAWYFMVFDYLLTQALANGYRGVAGLSFLDALRFLKGWDWLFIALSVYVACKTAFSAALPAAKSSDIQA